MSVPDIMHEVLAGVDYSGTAVALYVLMVIAFACSYTRPMQIWGPLVRVMTAVTFVFTFVADALVRDYLTAWEFGVITYKDGYPVYPELSAFVLIGAGVAAVFTAIITALFVSSFKSERRLGLTAAYLGCTTGILVAFGLLSYALGMVMPEYSTIQSAFIYTWMYGRDIAVVSGLLFLAALVLAERQSYGDRRFQAGIDQERRAWIKSKADRTPEAAETVQVAEVPASPWRAQT
jgi:hypothetical protein